MITLGEFEVRAQLRYQIKTAMKSIDMTSGTGRGKERIEPTTISGDGKRKHHEAVADEGPDEKRARL